MKILSELKTFAKNLTILVVEDDKELNAELVDIVKLFFKDVQFAYNGKDGLEIYKKNPTDIVLSDITMPFLNGVELSKKIRQINHEQNIIILSAHSEVTYLVDLIDIGIRQFVHKPFDDQELLYRLLKVCEDLVLSKEFLKNQELPAISTQPIKTKIQSIKTPEIPQTDTNEVLSHAVVDSKDFMHALQSDSVAWDAISEDINGLMELDEDFGHYIGLIYTDKITKEVLYGISSILRKMYTTLSQIDAMKNMTAVFFDLASFIESLDFTELTPEQINKFKFLEFIYDDLSRFLETVFIYKDTIDIHYLEDSLKSTVEQLKRNVLDIPLEEEELEFF